MGILTLMLKNKIIVGSVLFVASTPIYAQLDLYGEAIQGAMLVGKTYPNAMVKFDGITQKANAKGDFVIGLHRDTSSVTNIKIVRDGQTELYTIDIKSRKYEVQRINGLEKKKVNPPKTLLNRLKMEREAIKKARNISSFYTHYTQPWIHPTTGVITGVYGSQRVLNGKPKFPHYGLDYATVQGTKVVAPQSGVISLVQQDNFYSGKTVIIDHGMGVNTAYLHLSEISIKMGQKIKQGQIIGLVGTTGRSTGPHLDWRLNWGGVRLDPALLKGIDLGTNAKGKVVKRDKPL